MKPPAGPPQLLHAVIGVDYPGLSVDAEISAEPGKRLGLVGPNGAGKTTILRAIAGLQPIDRGRITLNGRIVDDPVGAILVPPQERRVGVVFQDYRLFPHMSALENVAFGLRCMSRDRRTARATAASWLARFDLSDHAHLRPAALSGGQAQRVALARALVTDPDVLLLDEPLSAIDPEARERIRDELGRHLTGFRGVTVIVSHQHDDIRALTTSALTLEDGRVSWSGPTDQLP